MSSVSTPHPRWCAPSWCLAGEPDGLTTLGAHRSAPRSWRAADAGVSMQLVQPARPGAEVTVTATVFSGGRAVGGVATGTAEAWAFCDQLSELLSGVR